MLKKVLLMTILGVFLPCYVFAEKVAISEATFFSKNGTLLVTTVNNAKYVLFNLENIKIVVDSKLAGTYADIEAAGSETGSRNFLFDGATEIVGKLIIYVRSEGVARQWYFALTRLDSPKFPQDIFPTVK